VERGIHAGHTDDREECRSQLVFRPKTIRPKIPCLPWLATGRTRRSIGLPIVSRGGANPFFCPNFITFFAGGTMGSTSAGHSAARTASGSSLRGTRCGSGPDPANTPVGPGQHREHHRVKDQMAESHRLLPERNPGQQKILSANQAGKPMFRHPLDRGLDHIPSLAGNKPWLKPLFSVRNWGIWASPMSVDFAGCPRLGHVSDTKTRRRSETVLWLMVRDGPKGGRCDCQAAINAQLPATEGGLRDNSGEPRDRDNRPGTERTCR
jgi:hypothetical protein